MDELFLAFTEVHLKARSHENVTEAIGNAVKGTIFGLEGWVGLGGGLQDQTWI